MGYSADIWSLGLCVLIATGKYRPINAGEMVQTILESDALKPPEGKFSTEFENLSRLFEQGPQTAVPANCFAISLVSKQRGKSYRNPLRTLHHGLPRYHDKSLFYMRPQKQARFGDLPLSFRSSRHARALRDLASAIYHTRSCQRQDRGHCPR